MQAFAMREVGFRLFQAAVHPAADPGLQAGRLPVGQLAWIVEKFWAWTDCDGHPENALTKDEMLDDVMLYWLTNSGPRRHGCTGRASAGSPR